jgi:hypothetical protein
LPDTDAEVSSDTINIVVAQINRISRTASLEFALRVGAVIIHNVYQGDSQAWRSRSRKMVSFRAIAEHPGLPMTAGSLYRCVAMFELCNRLNAPSRWEHLGASHLRMVLGLDSAAQERMLVAANEGRWTVKQLQQAVRQEGVTRVTRGGRRAETCILKIMKAASRWLDYQLPASQIACLSAEDIERSISVLEEVRLRLEDLSSSLTTALATLRGCAAVPIVSEPAPRVDAGGRRTDPMALQRSPVNGSPVWQEA